MSGNARLRIVVVGAGHLGGFHLAKVAALAGAQLVGVVECHAGRRAAAAQTYQVPGAADMAAFAGQADAAIIAAPTWAHVALGQQALALGWHVLMEKPMAPSVAGGRVLLQAAHNAGRVLQVGHTERFNPAIAAAMPLVQGPRYIVAERLGPFTGRSADVDVVLDLMIHDLDLVAALVPAALTEVRAVGISLMTNAVDMASARLQFADGTVAQLSAGRASLEPSRKLRFFTPERYVSVDCIARDIKSIRRVAAADGNAWPQISGEPVAVEAGDPLALQDEAFVACVRDNTQPRVCGQAGLRALRLVEAVKEAMAHGPETSAAATSASDGRRKGGHGERPSATQLRSS